MQLKGFSLQEKKRSVFKYAESKKICVKKTKF